MALPLRKEQEKVDDVISYDKLYELTDKFGLDVSWRKLNYYKSLGLLPKAIRKEGDKHGYYPFSTYYDLIVFHFLQNNLGLTLEEIKKLVKDFGLPPGGDTAESLFAKWIQQTYGRFITYMRRKMQKGGDALQRKGVYWIVSFNYLYKKALLETGIFYLEKNVSEWDMMDTQKMASDNWITTKADEWALKAVEDAVSK